MMTRDKLSLQAGISNEMDNGKLCSKEPGSNGMDNSKLHSEELCLF